MQHSNSLSDSPLIVVVEHMQVFQTFTGKTPSQVWTLTQLSTVTRDKPDTESSITQAAWAKGNLWHNSWKPKTQSSPLLPLQLGRIQLHHCRHTHSCRSLNTKEGPSGRGEPLPSSQTPYLLHSSPSHQQFQLQLSCNTPSWFGLQVFSSQYLVWCCVLDFKTTHAGNTLMF